MKLTIRKENPEDFKTVFNLIEKAFEYQQMSYHKEQFLVERLRKSNVFVPELSMVAETENKIVGHILLTKLKIKNGENEFDPLALAPVSVLSMVFINASLFTLWNILVSSMPHAHAGRALWL